MATFEPTIRSKDRQYAQVYIRIIHNRKIAYIKTEFMTDKFTKNKVKDKYIQLECSILIKQYVDRLNKVRSNEWDVYQVREYILRDHSSISFTDYADQYIFEMRKEGRTAPADNYKSALNSFKAFVGSEISFGDISTSILRAWIRSLADTRRAKNMYPTAIKTIFDAGVDEYNTDDLVLITNQPFKKKMIPSADVPEKRAIDVDALRKFFHTPVEGDLPNMAKDVALMIFCLAGMNTADLYRVKPEHVLKYNRKKTEARRRDKAYFQITVPDRVVFKYDFAAMYYNHKEFNKAVNKGLKQCCEQIGVEKVTSYVFRHTWATIAQNDIGASTDLVAFCLNHSSAHKETEGYIKKDFSRVDELNKKVMAFVFGCKVDDLM